MFKNNFDAIAIAILVLVLGIMQVPRAGVRIAQRARQQQLMKIQTVTYELSPEDLEDCSRWLSKQL